MDGGYHNDVFSAVDLPLPFPDVLQEFSVQTSSIPATYGERAGGVVNVVTKSGTNAYHGDLFEFVRNGAVNAKNYFALTVDEQKRNQFGGRPAGQSNTISSSSLVVGSRPFLGRRLQQPSRLLQLRRNFRQLLGDFKVDY